MIDLARNDKVTIFISTHFMNEAERCDRISLMHAGKVMISGAPSEIVRQCGAVTLEEAFIRYLEEAGAKEERPKPVVTTPAAGSVRGYTETPLQGAPRKRRRIFNIARALSYTLREALELRRDPIRATLALGGSVILLFIMGYGISLDVENLRFAVLDRDQTTLSQNYVLNLSASRYFTERSPISNYDELDRRMRTGELSLAIEIPPDFARDVKHDRQAQIGAWIDGAMPQRAETVQGYVQGMHQLWLVDTAKHRFGYNPIGFATVETRFRYNPDVKSLPAMVPAIIPLLLLMIPAMLTALSVVREKELGSIINLYVTPVTRAEFLLGKQLPYVALAMLNFLLLSLLAITVFGVPIKGSFLTLALASLIFVVVSTGMGLFASTFTRSQIAAIFLTIIGTMIPATQYAGLLNPVSSLEGAGKMIGNVYPVTYMFTISRGVFSKALNFADLHASFWPMLLAVPVVLGLSIILLKKQES